MFSPCNAQCNCCRFRWQWRDWSSKICSTALKSAKSALLFKCMEEVSQFSHFHLKALKPKKIVFTHSQLDSFPGCSCGCRRPSFRLPLILPVQTPGIWCQVSQTQKWQCSLVFKHSEAFQCFSMTTWKSDLTTVATKPLAFARFEYGLTIAEMAVHAWRTSPQWSLACWWLHPKYRGYSTNFAMALVGQLGTVEIADVAAAVQLEEVSEPLCLSTWQWLSFFAEAKLTSGFNCGALMVSRLQQDVSNMDLIFTGSCLEQWSGCQIFRVNC